MHQIPSARLCKVMKAEEDQNSHYLRQEFFNEPFKYTKGNLDQAHFIHKVSRDALWMDSRQNSFWKKGQLIEQSVAEDDGLPLSINAADRNAIPPSLIWACCKNKDLLTGTKLHHEIKKRGLAERLYSDALITMYAKCNEIEKARALLDIHGSTRVIPWNAVIASYLRQGQCQEALDCFEQMQAGHVAPSSLTYGFVLKACAVIGAIDKGRKVHGEILKQEFLEHDVVLGGALVDMYAKCGALLQARDALDKLPSRNVISWNALIGGYAQNGQGELALRCFELMQAEGIIPDAVTYSSILTVCASVGASDKGKQIHDEITRQGLLLHDVVLGNSLVDMYAKCGALPQARDVLHELPFRNVVSWTTMIAAYAQSGQGQETLDCFDQMQAEGIAPNAVTYACILKACASLGAINKGKQIHNDILRQGLLEHDVRAGNALVDMYAKCGALSQARDVLEKLPSRDVVSWNALIAGYTQEGQQGEAFKCYQEMQDDGILPDTVTFLCLLNVCSHLGLVEKGQELFNSMKASYGLKPTIECFNCMIGLLGRAGHLQKAVDLIRDMPFDGNIATWHAVLGACLKWRNVYVGHWAFEHVMELDKGDAAGYAFMANIYTATGMPEKAKNVEAMRIKNKAWKLPGCTWWTDSWNRPHEFCVGDVSKEITLKLQEISAMMLERGYQPNLDWISVEMSDTLKAEMLCLHSEKLILASALIYTPTGDGIYIRKNLHFCGNCHAVTSFISKVFKRKIVVTDADCRHCFEDGKCSCDSVRQI